MSDPATTPTFRTLLRDQRLAAGLTQATLAERAGLAERTIQELERGTARPRRETMLRLIAALEPSPEIRSQLEAVTPAPRRRAADGTHQSGRLGPHDGPERAGGYGTSWQAWGWGQVRVPTPMTSFVGRAADLAEIARSLDAHRLLTLTGAGGCGKTRLALEAASRAGPAFVDGVLFVSLASLGDSTALSSTIAKALAIPDASDRPALQQIVHAIGDRKLLLVLDNFEHLLPAATCVSDLVAGCSRLTVLVTSRSTLHLQGEHEMQVPPLGLPEPGDRPSVESLAQHSAVALFLERARSVRSDFCLTQGDAEVIVEICRRLDGLPLAMELAAARLRLLTPRDLLARLDHRFSLLTGGAVDLPDRQHTLHATITWSHDLLDERERRLLRRLSVFVGGWTLAQAEEVCDLEGAPEPATLDTLESLHTKSLVNRVEDVDGGARFRLLETIRAYALERLLESGEAPGVRSRYADYFLQLAEQAVPTLWGADMIAAAHRLDQEYDNVRAVLGWLQVEANGSGHLDDAGANPTDRWLRLVGALGPYWYARGRLNEGREWLERALAAPDWCSASARARALYQAGWFARLQVDHAQAWRHLEESRVLSQRIGDMAGVAAAVGRLGEVARVGGEYAQAQRLFDEHLALRRAVGDPRGIALALGGLGLLARDLGDYKRAATCLEASLALYRTVRDLYGIAWSLTDLAWVLLEQGCQERAVVLGEESLALFHALHDRRGIASSLSHQARVALSRGESSEAASRYQDSLSLYWRLGDREGIIRCVEGLAEVAIRDARTERAARLLGSAQALREAAGRPLTPAEREGYAATVTATRAGLSTADHAAASAVGRASDVEQTVSYALEAPGRRDADRERASVRL